ncbi:MAG: YolD-like family protein [Oscillospiraceae bacterium]|nr:YolD-like family protein [Oscillospiraceae bacterium]
MKNPYEDIINLPHHVSKTHPQMSMQDRAAQFSPFAALTGYDDAIDETARLTGKKLELGEEAKEILDRKLQYLQSIISEQPEISATYFVPDEKKDGGEYVTVNGRLKRIDEYERVLVLTDGKKILMEEIIDIKSELFTGDFYEESFSEEE